MYAMCHINVFGIGLILAKNGNLTIGDLTSITMCVSFVLSEIINSILPLINGIAYFKQSTRRYNYFLGLKPYKTDGENLNKIDSITLKNLSYSYDNKNNILKNVNMRIKMGEKIGIIGQIGSGKTTLMNIISGFLEVPNNHVYINDIDINKYSREEIFKNISYATQKNIILDDTVENNINITKNSNVNVEQLSRLSNLYIDVQKMENRFQTVIGERGNRLSGGQKQRVQIARTLSYIRNINIFDDTLSALDVATENAVLDSIIEETENKILILVSNKVSNMEKLDKVYMLIDGEIYAQGTHQELLQTNTLYQELYNYEMEGELV